VTSGHDQAFQEQVGARLKRHFTDLGFQISRVEAGATFVASITETLDVLVVVLLVLALLTALVGSIGLAGTLSMNVLERSREIGVLRAIGADNRIITRLVLVEATVMGLMSFVLAALLSFPITTLLSDIVNLAIFNHRTDFALTAWGFVVWLGVVLLMSASASILPARSASRLTIREVLAYQ
jgi:putative ABC transport system permease protein